MSEHIVAHSITLVDEANVPRIVLTAKRSLPSIVLLGEGKSAVQVEIDGAKPRVLLLDPEGNHALALAVDATSRTIVIYDKSRLPCAKVTYDSETAECFVELNKEGQPVRRVVV